MKSEKQEQRGASSSPHIYTLVTTSWIPSKQRFIVAQIGFHRYRYTKTQCTATSRLESSVREVFRGVVQRESRAAQENAPLIFSLASCRLLLQTYRRRMQRKRDRETRSVCGPCLLCLQSFLLSSFSDPFPYLPKDAQQQYKTTAADTYRNGTKVGSKQGV